MEGLYAVEKKKESQIVRDRDSKRAHEKCKNNKTTSNAGMENCKRVLSGDASGMTLPTDHPRDG